MNLLPLFFILLLCVFFDDAAGQPSQAIAPDDPSLDVPPSFRPTIPVVIGVLSIMFSLTFLLLMYARFCHAAAAELFNNVPDQNNGGGLVHPRARFSGIDKTVIESLPFFRFSSLKGSKEGLECAVCLSRFEETEVLRLLPKCKHAFHINCVDRWLENHSSCPLCRYRVDPEDLTIFKYSSNSLRFTRDPSDLIGGDDPNVELFVRREPEDGGGSSRFSVGGSFRKMIEKGGKKDELLIPDGAEKQQFLDRYKHRIIVSDVVFKNRWSDVNSSDLMFLNSEMLSGASSRRFSSLESRSERFTAKPVSMDFEPSISDENILKIKEEMEKKRQLESRVINLTRSHSASASAGEPSSSNLEHNYGKTLDLSAKRSMSEMTNLARFPDFGVKSEVGDQSGSAPASDAKEERVRKLWLPIARRTLQWLAGRERRSRPPHPRQGLNV